MARNEINSPVFLHAEHKTGVGCDLLPNPVIDGRIDPVSHLAAAVKSTPVGECFQFLRLGQAAIHRSFQSIGHSRSAGWSRNWFHNEISLSALIWAIVVNDLGPFLWNAEGRPI